MRGALVFLLLLLPAVTPGSPSSHGIWFQADSQPSTRGIRLQPDSHEFTWKNQYFILDGRPFVIRSGEMHYPRIPNAAWRDRSKKARAMGLNTICTYVFWNLHEPRPGVFDIASGSTPPRGARSIRRGARLRAGTAGRPPARNAGSPARRALARGRADCPGAARPARGEHGADHFGARLVDDRKGLVNPVTLAGVGLTGWEIYALPLDDLEALRFSPNPVRGPAFYRGSFTLEATGDTFLDLRGWGKGHVEDGGRRTARGLRDPVFETP